MKYPIANNYIETLERVRRQLFGVAFPERHPDPLAYEEIQAMASDVNALDIMKLYREAVSSDSMRLYKGMFSDILRNPHVVNGTARKRITILPYYPAGTTLINDNGNKIVISASDKGLIGTETDAEGKELAEHEIISYLFDGDRITKRLLDEGRNADYILFFLSQTNQLHEAIFERLEDVRVMFDYIEKGNLKKFKKADFDTALLEKEGKEKPEAWKAETIIMDKANSEDVEKAAKHYRGSGNTFIPDYRKIKNNGNTYILLTFLKGGYKKKGVGCLRPGTEQSTLKVALEGGVLSEISNGNRVDILLYVFEVFSKKYISTLDRDKYNEDIRLQAAKFGKVPDTAQIPTDIRNAIDELMKP